MNWVYARHIQIMEPIVLGLPGPFVGERYREVSPKRCLPA